MKHHQAIHIHFLVFLYERYAFCFFPQRQNQTKQRSSFKDPSVVARSGPQHFGRPPAGSLSVCPSPLPPCPFHCTVCSTRKPHRSQLLTVQSLTLATSSSTLSLWVVRRPWRSGTWLLPLKCPSNQGGAKQPDAAAQSQRTVLGNSTAHTSCLSEANRGSA